MARVIEFPRGKKDPALAAVDAAGDRFYHWLDESYWSVTTIIGGGVPKYALVPWAAKVVAELVLNELLSRGPSARVTAAIRRWTKLGIANVRERQARGELKTVKVEKLEPTELALRFLKAEPERQRDAAAAIGSDVHTEAEELVLEHARESAHLVLEGKEVRAWPTAIAGYQQSFVNWLEDYRPVFLASEATVFNRTQAFAGTLDCIIRIQIAPDVFAIVIVDYKSGNQVYPEVGMQLAAYARGEFIGAPDGITELPLPQAGRGAVLHLRPAPTRNYPRGYRFRWVSIDDVVYRKFLHAREIFQWGKETSKDVLGEDVPLPVAA